MLATPLDAATCRKGLPQTSLQRSTLLSQVRLSVCPLVPLSDSMNFLANAWSPRPSSAKSDDSFSSDCPQTPDELVTPTSTVQESLDKLNDNSALGSPATPRARKPAAGHRTKTTFQLRYPPPTTKQRQRLHLRPRLLLQLHRTSQVSRPTPTFDVLPSMVFAPRLARKFPHTFKGKAGLGANDLVVVSSEDYSAEPEGTEHSEDWLEHETWKSRGIIAAICQLSQGDARSERKAEICLSQRRSWMASALSRGGYEFVSIDEHGVQKVARWIPRRKAIRRQSSSDTASAVAEVSAETPAFSFSMLDPSSRRHAIIATMDAQSMSIFNSYSKPRPGPSDDDDDHSTHDGTAQSKHQSSVQVDESLRNLIVVTGIFVASSEGFLSTQGYSQPAAAAATTSTQSDTKSHHKRRALSLNVPKDQQEAVPEPSETGGARQIRPCLHQSGSSSTVPTSPTASASIMPRRTKSVTAPFMRRASSLRYPIAEDGGYDTNTTTEVSTERTESSSTGSDTGATSYPQNPAPTKTARPTESAMNVPGCKHRPKIFTKLFGPHKRRNGTTGAE